MNEVQMTASTAVQSELESHETVAATPASGEESSGPKFGKAAVLGSLDKPPIYPIHADAIPDELKREKRWLGWKWVKKDETAKWGKPPIDARTGRFGSSTDSTTWCSFDEALAGVQAGRCDGIGFALGEVDGYRYAGIDLDDCRNPTTGELSDVARDVLGELNCYAEISPSQTGLKFLCRITNPPGKPTRNEAGTVEIYSEGRYFTITGQHIAGTPTSIEDRQEELMAAWQKYIGSEKRGTDTGASAKPRILSAAEAVCDDPALAAMFRHKPPANENDGSKRLFCVACRAVEYDLSDEQAVALIRAYERQYPFPSGWSDNDILQRLRSAEQHAERGAALCKIDTSTRDLAIITPLAWTALQRANEPPSLFRCGGAASRIETGDEGDPIIRILDQNRMRHHLARAAKWIKWEKRGEDYVEKAIEPPISVVNDVLATPDQPLPILSRLVEAPVFAADGTLQTMGGYHPASQTYYAPADGFLVPNVSSHPTPEEIALARTLLCDELLGDFPFVGLAELAHAVALLLLPFTRDLIAGPTPLHLVEKPSPGTGATLLVDMLSLPSIGRAIPAMTEASDEEEWRKRLTAKLRSGSPFILIDNVRRRLDSAALAAAITSTTWEDRILGSSEVVRLPVRCAWLATGNNPALSTEIARRTVRIRLDAKMDRPWLRDKFRHANLREWASQMRGQLVWAALTLIQAWISAAKPPGRMKLGMYERWSEVMGGVLNVANINGFLANLAEFYDDADAEAASWVAFIAAWWQAFQNAEKSVKDLWQIVSDAACLPLGGGNEQSQKITLGKMLADRRDRIFELDGEPSKLILRRGNKRQGAFRWYLAIPTLAA
jgi:hypothetical protein